MTITKTTEGSNIVLSPEGRIDTVTAPELDSEVTAAIAELGSSASLVLDFANLVYISSAGLRVLLTAHKTMSKKEGTFVIRNVNKNIMEIFTLTGFSKILNIEAND